MTTWSPESVNSFILRPMLPPKRLQFLLGINSALFNATFTIFDQVKVERMMLETGSHMVLKARTILEDRTCFLIHKGPS